MLGAGEIDEITIVLLTKHLYIDHQYYIKNKILDDHQ